MREDVGMDVAVVSVISSGLVAVGSLVLQWRNGAEQRRHDATQAFEARAWDLKREGHLSLLDVLNRIRDSADDGYVVATKGRSWLEEFYEAQPVVVAYGTDECRHDLDALMTFVADFGPLDETVRAAMRRAYRANQEVENAFDNPNDATPMGPRLQERTDAQQLVRDLFIYSEPELRRLVVKLIASTRSSLRGGL